MTNQPGSYRNAGAEDNATRDGPNLPRIDLSNLRRHATLIVDTKAGHVLLHRGPSLTPAQALDLLEDLQSEAATLQELARTQMIEKLRTERGYSDEALRAVGLLE